MTVDAARPSDARGIAIVSAVLLAVHVALFVPGFGLGLLFLMPVAVRADAPGDRPGAPARRRRPGPYRARPAPAHARARRPVPARPPPLPADLLATCSPLPGVGAGRSGDLARHRLDARQPGGRRAARLRAGRARGRRHRLRHRAARRRRLVGHPGRSVRRDGGRPRGTGRGAGARPWTPAALGPPPAPRSARRGSGTRRASTTSGDCSRSAG